jgi:hypothetical protein
VSDWRSIFRRGLSSLRVRIKTIGRWFGIVLFAAVIITGGVCFIWDTYSAWATQTSARVSCSLVVNPNAPFSYVQYNIKDQAIEPFFRGSVFVSLGDVPTGPSRVDIVTSGARGYGNQTIIVTLHRDEAATSFWMTRESLEAQDVAFYRTSGSHRDFPLDSAAIDFDTAFGPKLQLARVMIRNLNTSFYIPCDAASATADSSGKIHVHFEMRRNPLVRLMALVILVAAALFVCIIPFAVKREALATSVASFFFSIWSVRGILGSEMKVFPTLFDMMILFLCVLLLLLIGFKFLGQWIKPQGI